MSHIQFQSHYQLSVNAHNHSHTHTSTRIHTHTSTRIHTHICANTDTHTHTHTCTSCSRYWLSLSSVRPCTRQRRANSRTIGSGKLQSSSSRADSGCIKGQSFNRQYIWEREREKEIDR